LSGRVGSKSIPDRDYYLSSKVALLISSELSGVSTAVNIQNPSKYPNPLVTFYLLPRAKSSPSSHNDYSVLYRNRAGPIPARDVTKEEETFPTGFFRKGHIFTVKE